MFHYVHQDIAFNVLFWSSNLDYDYILKKHVL